MKMNLEASEKMPHPPDSTTLGSLKKREWAVLFALGHDLSNADLADRLSLSIKSVENYKTCIGHTLGVQGRDELARYARRYANEIREWYKLITGKLPPPPEFSY
jgi:DNA-binding NarL/FixJ family response regulator